MTKIMIIGSGIVGQANGKGLMKKGHDVIFIDNNPRIISTLKSEGFKGCLPTEISNDNNDADISMFCVPTPFTIDRRTVGSINLSPITSSIVQHSSWIRDKKKRKKKETEGTRKRDHKYQHLVVIRSTVLPGTTRNVLLPLLELHSEMKVGRDLGLCMQPEFLRSASGESDFLNPHATVIGEFDKASGDKLEDLYSNFDGHDHQIFRTDLDTAEFMKYVQNCFNATKISFANEMWLLGQKLGVDANFALQMAVAAGEGYWNPHYGSIGGQPYDGVCLPKDIKGFLSFANENYTNMPLISVVDMVNSHMKELAQQKQTKKRLAKLTANASKT
jgi:UDPglucose 6-dehydrogenase